jgi:ABC-type sugar transport system ATPase subunit
MYDKPANLFVAGFIGSPAMNLVQTNLDGDLVHFGAANVQVPRAGMDALGSERSVHLGVRPEDLNVVERVRACPPRSTSSRSSAPTRTSTAAPISAASAARSSRGSTAQAPGEGFGPAPRAAEGAHAPVPRRQRGAHRPRGVRRLR